MIMNYKNQIRAALAALTAGLAISSASSAFAEVRDGYQTPSFTIPYATKKPVMDGTVNDAEWEGAFSINALQTVARLVSPRKTRFWVMWDEENLYIAMRSPLRRGERVVQTNRQKDGDNALIVWDDSYEMWIDAGTRSPDGQPVFFQFLSNFAGARNDVMIEPAVGNSRPGWTSGWEPANRITPDGKFWEMEIAIPRESVLLDKPFADGQKLACLLARNFKREWEQNSVEGTGSFSVRDTYSQFTLSKTAPAIHLLNVADPANKTFGMELTAFGTTGDAKLKWSFASDGGIDKTGVLNVEKGKLAPVVGEIGFDSVGTGGFRIRVTSDDGKTTYLDWSSSRQFGFEMVQKEVEVDGKMKKVSEPVNQAVKAIDDKGDVVRLSLQFNPVRDYLRVTGDFIQFDDRAKIDRCEVVIAPKSGAQGTKAGKELAREDFKIDELSYVRGLIHLKDIPYGEYVATLTCFDKDGRVLRTSEAAFEKKDPSSFVWWNTKAGNIDKVLAPWTPVKNSGDAVEVWGRTMTIGAAGLPAEIISAGKNVLAGPMSLQAEMADGKTIEAAGGKLKRISKADYRYVAESTGKLGNIDVTSRVTVEYDGMYKVEMTLTPRGEAKVDSLKMVVPIAAETGEYIYGKAEGVRTNFDMRFVPKEGTGVIWDCRKAETSAMVEGSFIPYVWIGNTKRGFCWFADSDQGWTPNAKTPAIHLVRNTNGGPLDLVFNFIASPETITQPRTIVFAFQASPVKAMRPGWRMDTWWCGDTFTNFVYPDGKGSTIWQSLPFTKDVEACRKMVEARHAEYEFFPGGPKRRSNAVPYFEHNSMGPSFEQKYFGEEWQAAREKAGLGQLWYGESLQDYIIHNLDKWIKDCGIDGWYLDNVRPVTSDNTDAGRGYLLPDGRTQPTYNLFAMREFFLRLRAIWQENGKTSEIVNHMTNNMILPWNGAVDIAYDGEHHVIYPDMDKDFMDFWSLERLRMDYPAQWGVAINFMTEYQGAWDPVRLAKVMRAYYGAIMLHDTLFTGNNFTDAQTKFLLAERERFGLGEDDVTFLPYWDGDSGLSCATKDVYLAGWLRPGKLMVAVVNFGEKTDATIRIDGEKLGLGPASGWKVTDVEADTKVPGWEGTGKDRKAITVWDAVKNGGPVKVDGKGGLIVPVERHDFRLIVIEKK